MLIPLAGLPGFTEMLIPLAGLPGFTEMLIPLAADFLNLRKF
jgi:hypothetical protein